MNRQLIWPFLTTCRPKIPLGGWGLCSIVKELGHADLNWALENELDPEDVTGAADKVRRVFSNCAKDGSEAAIAVRSFAKFQASDRDHDRDLADRFAETIKLGGSH